MAMSAWNPPAGAASRKERQFAFKGPSPFTQGPRPAGAAGGRGVQNTGAGRCPPTGQSPAAASTPAAATPMRSVTCLRHLSVFTCEMGSRTRSHFGEPAPGAAGQATRLPHGKQKKMPKYLVRIASPRPGPASGPWWDLGSNLGRGAPGQRGRMDRQVWTGCWPGLGTAVKRACPHITSLLAAELRPPGLLAPTGSAATTALFSCPRQSTPMPLGVPGGSFSIH